MELNTHHPTLIPAKTAVLLVFLPSVASYESISQRSSLMKLIEPLQRQLGGLVRVLKIDEPMHPDVVRSFDIRQLPAFVLVNQGVELWRQEGMSTTDEATFVLNLIGQMDDHLV